MFFKWDRESGPGLILGFPVLSEIYGFRSFPFFCAKTEKPSSIFLTDSNYLCAVLSYMYRGEINVLQDDLGPLIETARGLQIKGLADAGGSAGGGGTGSTHGGGASGHVGNLGGHVGTLGGHVGTLGGGVGGGHMGSSGVGGLPEKKVTSNGLVSAPKRPRTVTPTPTATKVPKLDPPAPPPIR